MRLKLLGLVSVFLLASACQGSCRGGVSGGGGGGGVEVKGNASETTK